jgi:hypothetical protein
MFPRTSPFIAALVLVLPLTAFGQADPVREAAVDKLIDVQAAKAGDFLDERTLEALISRFRRTNPGVTEDVWRSVKSEVKLLFFRILSEREGPFSKAVRQAMPQFTTGEIEKLVAIHTDPLFVKYTDATLAAIKSPAGELALLVAIEKSVVEMNDVVMKRGLKPAY